METEYSRAWEKFAESDEFKEASDMPTLPFISKPEYLVNRLKTAYAAGWTARGEADDGKS